MFLLDTMVVSEGSKSHRDSHVARWLASVPAQQLFTSVVTIAEIQSGIGRLDPGSRRTSLENWFQMRVLQQFKGRILEVDLEVAKSCGHVIADVHRQKAAKDMMDIWIAAIASHHGMTVATRNARDFDGLGVPTVNPWQVPQ